MITFSQFKQSLNIQGAVEFKTTSKGRQVATVSTLSSHGIRVNTTIWKAKTYDIKNPNKYIAILEDQPNVYVLCNSSMTAGDAE